MPLSRGFMAQSLDILLAVRNGEKYLPALLDSLFSQEFQDFMIVASDDGSTDATLNVIKAYQDRFPERIRVLKFDRAAGSARGNFARLLEACTADFAMFCDQDDIWLPQKITLTLARARAAEAEYGVDTPILVHTDLTVVDEHLSVLSPSLWQYQFISPGAGLNR